VRFFSINKLPGEQQLHDIGHVNRIGHDLSAITVEHTPFDFRTPKLRSFRCDAYVTAKDQLQRAREAVTIYGSYDGFRHVSGRRAQPSGATGTGDYRFTSMNESDVMSRWSLQVRMNREKSSITVTSKTLDCGI